MASDQTTKIADKYKAKRVGARNGQPGGRREGNGQLGQPRVLRTTDGMMEVTNKTQDAMERPTLYL